MVGSQGSLTIREAHGDLMLRDRLHESSAAPDFCVCAHLLPAQGAAEHEHRQPDRPTAVEQSEQRAVVDESRGSAAGGKTTRIDSMAWDGKFCSGGVRFVTGKQEACTASALRRRG